MKQKNDTKKKKEGVRFAERKLSRIICCNHASRARTLTPLLSLYTLPLFFFVLNEAGHVFTRSRKGLSLLSWLCLSSAFDKSTSVFDPVDNFFFFFMLYYFLIYSLSFDTMHRPYIKSVAMSKRHFIIHPCTIDMEVEVHSKCHFLGTWVCVLALVASRNPASKSLESCRQSCTRISMVLSVRVVDRLDMDILPHLRNK